MDVIYHCVCYVANAQKYHGMQKKEKLLHGGPLKSRFAARYNQLFLLVESYQDGIQNYIKSETV